MGRNSCITDLILLKMSVIELFFLAELLEELLELVVLVVEDVPAVEVPAVEVVVVEVPP